MREEHKSDWRKDLKQDAKELATGGDHPYVDVMPDGDQVSQMAKNKVKDKKKKEEVSESIVDDEEHRKNFKDAADNVAKGMEARRKKLDLGKKK